MKLHLFLISFILLFTHTSGLEANNLCKEIFNGKLFSPDSLDFTVRTDRTVSKQELINGTADLILTIDEVLKKVPYLLDRELQKEVYDVGYNLIEVLRRLLENILENENSTKVRRWSLIDFDENIIVLLARFKNISEEFYITLLKPETISRTTNNVFLYALENDINNPSSIKEIQIKQRTKIELLTKITGFKIPYHTEARFVQIERTTSPQMLRGNSELIFILEEIYEKGSEEDRQAARNLITYLDENKQELTNPDFELYSLSEQIFHDSVYLQKRYPDSFAVALRGMHETLHGSRWSNNLSYNCFNVGLNNAHNDEAIGIMDPVNISRKKALLGENGGTTTVDMQIAHGLISLEAPPKGISTLQDLWHNKIRRRGVSAQNQVNALIRERKKVRYEQVLDNALKKMPITMFVRSGVYYEVPGDILPEKETKTLKLIYKDLENFSLFDLKFHIRRSVGEKIVPFLMITNQVIAQPLLPLLSIIQRVIGTDDVNIIRGFYNSGYCFSAHHFITIENGHVVGLRYVPLDPVLKESQVNSIIENFSHLKELSLLVDSTNLDIDLITKLQLHLNLEELKLSRIWLGNEGIPGRLFEKTPYFVEKPVNRARLERDLFKSTVSLVKLDKNSPPPIVVSNYEIALKGGFIGSNEKDIPRRGDIYAYNKPKADRSEERLSFDFYSLLSNKKSVFFDPPSDEIFSLHVDPIGPYVKTDRNGVYYVKGTNFLLNSALGMIYYIQFVNGESHEKYYGKSRFYSDYDDYLLLSKEGDVIRRNSKKDSHPKQEFKSLGIEEFWTGHNNHFVIVERDDSDPDFKGEQFIYRIYVDDKLVGTYSNIEQYRYAEIYEKDGTKLFSLDNHLYQHPNTKYNETDVLRIEIDMDRVLGD